MGESRNDIYKVWWSVQRVIQDIKLIFEYPNEHQIMNQTKNGDVIRITIINLANPGELSQVCFPGESGKKKKKKIFF